MLIPSALLLGTHPYDVALAGGIAVIVAVRHQSNLRQAWAERNSASTHWTRCGPSRWRCPQIGERCSRGLSRSTHFAVMSSSRNQPPASRRRLAAAFGVPVREAHPDDAGAELGDDDFAQLAAAVAPAGASMAVRGSIPRVGARRCRRLDGEVVRNRPPGRSKSVRRLSHRAGPEFLADRVGSQPSKRGSDDLGNVGRPRRGAVTHPGIVTLPAGSRVAEALAAAGGPVPGTSLDNPKSGEAGQRW